MEQQELYKIMKEALSERVTLDLFSFLVIVLLTIIASYVGAYVRTKGKNLATKEDIEGITHEIENVKTQYAKQLEMLSHDNRIILSELQQRHDLKLAALDKRLAVHQEAYVLWWELMNVLHDGEKSHPVTIKCQEWFVKNSLYLTEESRNAFHEAYMETIIRTHLLTDRKNNAEEIKENFIKIRDAGPKIVESVNLPSWGDKEYSPIDEH
jgi:hypothetical protein